MLTNKNFEHASIADSENTSKYLKNPWNKKYKSGLFFTALLDLNQHIDIPFKLKVKHQKSEEFIKVAHALHDGFSALKVINSERDLDLQLKLQPIRKCKKIVPALFSALTSKPKQAHSYINQSNFQPGTEFRAAEISFPIIKTDKSQTALYALAASHVLQQKFLNSDYTRWMVPVRTSNEDGLQASYIALDIDKNSTFSQIHSQLVDKLKKGQHWGFHYLAKIALLLGKKTILKATKKSLENKNKLWFGSISNLGNLNESHQIEQLYIYHPVRWHRPIGIIIYEFNGEQHLTLSIHKSLNSNDPQELVNEIKQYALTL